MQQNVGLTEARKLVFARNLPLFVVFVVTTVVVNTMDSCFDRGDARQTAVLGKLSSLAKLRRF